LGDNGRTVVSCRLLNRFGKAIQRLNELFTAFIDRYI